MKNERDAKHLREELDAVFKKWRRTRDAAPKGGWVLNIREALGMSTQQLAARLKMSQAGVVTLQQSEAKKTIQLSTLQKAAKAVGCDLVYALVPLSGAIDKTLERRRMLVAEHGLRTVLRKSSLTAAEKNELVAAYAKKLKAKKVWEQLTYPEFDKLIEEYKGRKKG